ncbi:MBL fold metallo-hydrolase [Thalassotalea fonticola]|uniref:MBL fold metallo-hydrolase n=1 Tax=Thalassotalea fonticola TaxID=3065649 RepID=A0ABZ0GRX7_9GAMM|nr:MBL fold metallo-hydrolase [Colwelliaceae bacterium S1-1]
MTSCAIVQPNSNHGTIENSPQFNDGKFQNSKALDTMSLKKIPEYIKRYLSEKRKDVAPIKPIPVQRISTEALKSLPADSITLFRLGHSSFLLKAENAFWLIDPVFSDRASPFSFIGPKRFHQPPISIEELPEIRGVIISHNHYDHLDKSAIKAMAKKVATFIVPLGIAADLEAWGIDSNKIIELDWWQSSTIAGLELTMTPAQHFSGRGLTDSNKTLWGSWVIKSSKQSVFYSGDSGYFDGFKRIGEKYGPFDLTIIETGAYDKDWPDVHMTPEQSLQAHIDVKGKRMLPAHNGTFDLAFHPWYEPLERITHLGKSASIDIITPIVGEPVAIAANISFLPWWQGLN